MLEPKAPEADEPLPETSPPETLLAAADAHRGRGARLFVPEVAAALWTIGS